MNNTPAIIFKMKAFKPNDTSDEAKFFRCKNSSNYLNYIGRKNAQDIDEKAREFVENVVDISGKLPDKNYIDYASNRGGSTGLFSTKGNCSKQEIATAMKQLNATKSIVWAGILSFTPEMATKICSNKAQAQQLINEHIKTLFKNSQLDYENIQWFGAYHTNTDNPHIHLTFYEKAPILLTAKGKKQYNYKLVLPIENLTGFKYSILQDVKNNNYSFMALRNPIRNSLKTNVLNDKFHLKNVLSLTKNIIDKGQWQYARLTKPNQKIIDDVVQYTLRNFPDTLLQYNNYQTELLKTQASFISLAKENNIKPSDEAQHFFSSRIIDLNQRLGNEMLHIIKNEHFRELTKEKSLAISLKNEKFTKMPTLKNSFVKKSNMLDITTSELNKILLRFAKDMSRNINEQSMESYKIEKQIKGETLIYD